MEFEVELFATIQLLISLVLVTRRLHRMSSSLLESHLALIKSKRKASEVESTQQKKQKKRTISAVGNNLYFCNYFTKFCLHISPIEIASKELRERSTSRDRIIDQLHVKSTSYSKSDVAKIVKANRKQQKPTKKMAKKIIATGSRFIKVAKSDSNNNADN